MRKSFSACLAISIHAFSHVYYARGGYSHRARFCILLHWFSIYVFLFICKHTLDVLCLLSNTWHSFLKIWHSSVFFFKHVSRPRVLHFWIPLCCISTVFLIKQNRRKYLVLRGHSHKSDTFLKCSVVQDATKDQDKHSSQTCPLSTFTQKNNVKDMSCEWPLLG